MGLKSKAKFCRQLRISTQSQDQLDLAVNLAQTIDDSYQRDLALTKLAVICATDGDGDQADSLWK